MKLSGLFLWLVTMLLVFAGCNNKAKQEAETSKFILYVGTYTETPAGSERKSEGIYIYEFDTNTGTLEYVNVSPFTANPSFLDISSDGRFLFTVNETGGAGSPGGISAFRMENEGKNLTFINMVSSEGEYPCYVEVDKTGKYVMVANYGTGNIGFFPVKADGVLQNAIFTDMHEGKGTTSRQEAAHAHSIRLSPDNRFAYSCDLGTDRIYIYRFDAANGLIDSSGFYQVEEGAGPRHLEFHPSRNLVYVINELNGTIGCLKRDTLTGALTAFQVISTVQDSGTLAGCADIHITTTGEFLYGSNRGPFNSLAMYIVDDNGSLTYTGSQSVKGLTPRNFTIDPTGKWLLVANQNSDQIVTFRIDPKLGKLVETGIETIVPKPVCLKFLTANNEK